MMNKSFFLNLGIANALLIVADIINKKWGVLLVNIIICVLCLVNFIEND